MKMKVKLKGLCCANCAAKIEAAVGKLEGVQNAALSFLTEKLILEISVDPEVLKPQIQRIVSKIEPDVTMEYL